MTKTAATVAAVNAIIAVASLTVLSLSEDQLAAIYVAVNAVAVAVAAWFDPAVPFGK